MTREREPVALVHGLAGSARWWRRAAAAIAEHHPVHLVDLPGFGAERRTRFLLEDAPAAVRASLEREGITRAHLVGHSLGGVVAARVAAEWPELVERLVLVAPAGYHEHARIRRHAVPLALALRHSRPSFLPLLVADALRAGPATLLSAARELLAADVAPDLERIAAPTLLVWGEHDPLIRPAAAEYFHTAIPNAKLAVIPRAAHVPMVERPNEFVGAVLGFLGGR